MNEQTSEPTNATSMEMRWLNANRAQIEQDHPGMWVAVSGSRLVAAAETLSEVLSVARSQGVEHPLVTSIRSRRMQGVKIIRRWP